MAKIAREVAEALDPKPPMYRFTYGANPCLELSLDMAKFHGIIPSGYITPWASHTLLATASPTLPVSKPQLLRRKRSWTSLSNARDYGSA